jgi:hypothetical protein
MKTNYILFLLSLFLVSCSDDDANTPPPTGPVATAPAEYLPIENGNFWIYDVENSSGDNGTDSLYVANDTIIGGNNYKKLKSGDVAYGLYSTVLNNNSIRRSGDSLLFTGTASVGLSEELPLNLNVTDFILVKESARNGEVLDTETGTIELPYEGFTIIADYKLSSIAKESLPTYTSPNGQQYSNVKKIEMHINLKVNVSMSGFSMEIMPAQDVVVSTQYYAEGIGMVHALTDMHYEFSDLSGMGGGDMPMPQSGAEHQEEVLVRHNAN